MFELAVAIALIALNGLFALSELAIVSARKPRLRALRDQGASGAAQALTLAEDSGRFLSTVQIGITLIGILAGAFSGAALSQRFDEILEGWGVPTRFAEPLAYVVVIGAITYLSVIIGELAPKQIALRNPERIACAVAPAMSLLSRAAAPLIWLLDASTQLVFRLLRLPAQSEAAVTDQDIKAIVAEAQSAGVIETHERTMIQGVLRLGDRPVRGVMTPRTDVTTLDLAWDEAEIRRRLATHPRNQTPVTDGDPDIIVGVVLARDIAAALVTENTLDLRSLVRKAQVLPDTVGALDALAALRKAETPMALVYDEYGNFEGVVTPADILDAIAGAFHSDEFPDETEAKRRADGSWLLSGALPADEMAEHLNLPLPTERDYQTVAGFVIAALERLPETGESVVAFGWRFEIVDMDGRRVDKVLASLVE